MVQNSTIPPFLVGRRIRIYNGAWFLVQTINSEWLGLNLVSIRLLNVLMRNERVVQKLKRS